MADQVSVDAGCTGGQLQQGVALIKSAAKAIEEADEHC